MITRRDLFIGSLGVAATAAAGGSLIARADAAVRDPLWVGACPRIPGGSSLSAAQRVIDVWGNRAAVRQFNGGGLGTPLRIPNTPLIHYSWKPSSASAITTSNVSATLDQAVEGDQIIVAEVWHEIDKKVRDGVFSRNDGIGRKNKFYDVVKDLYGDRVLVGEHAHRLEGGPGQQPHRRRHPRLGRYRRRPARHGLRRDQAHLPAPTSGTSMNSGSVHDFLTSNRADLYTGWAVP